MIIETTRLQLRLLNNTDASMILTLLNQASFIKNIGDKAVKNKLDAIAYINNGPLSMQRELGFSLYCCVAKSDNQAIGITGLIKRDGIEQPEIGFAFLDQYCRQGYGFEAAEAVVNFAKNKLSINHLQAICNLNNNASKSLLLRLGFCFNKNIELTENKQVVMLFDLIKASF